MSENETRPFADLRSTGLLWLVNTTVFHPRGYSLGIALDDDGNATGWTLYGDGTEPWQFRDPDPMPEGQMSIDECFAAARALLP